MAEFCCWSNRFPPVRGNWLGHVGGFWTAKKKKSSMALDPMVSKPNCDHQKEKILNQKRSGLVGTIGRPYTYLGINVHKTDLSWSDSEKYQLLISNQPTLEEEWSDYSSSPICAPNSDSLWMHLFLINNSWISWTPNATILTIKEAFKMKVPSLLKMMQSEEVSSTCCCPKEHSASSLLCAWPVCFTSWVN